MACRNGTEIGRSAGHGWGWAYLERNFDPPPCTPSPKATIRDRPLASALFDIGNLYNALTALVKGLGAM
jgi:hypothetical protein